MSNIDTKKSELAAIESKIKIIADNPGRWITDYEKREQVKDMLKMRQHILNDMFQPTDETMQRFRALNDRLYYLTQLLHNRVRALDAKRPLVMDCPDFDDDFEIEGTLRFIYNDEDSVLKLPDDESYGSDFSLMIKIIADLAHGTMNEDIEQFDVNSIMLDDGQSWKEYPFGNRPRFDNVIICHAVHQLTSHQLYSIPDLLRLNDYWAEVRLAVQSITEQDGARY